MTYIFAIGRAPVGCASKHGMQECDFDPSTGAISHDLDARL
jgi:hypothetical protein